MVQKLRLLRFLVYSSFEETLYITKLLLSEHNNFPSHFIFREYKTHFTTKYVSLESSRTLCIFFQWNLTRIEPLGRLRGNFVSRSVHRFRSIWCCAIVLFMLVFYKNKYSFCKKNTVKIWFEWNLNKTAESNIIFSRKIVRWN